MEGRIRLFSQRENLTTVPTAYLMVCLFELGSTMCRPQTKVDLSFEPCSSKLGFVCFFVSKNFNLFWKGASGCFPEGRTSRLSRPHIRPYPRSRTIIFGRFLFGTPQSWFVGFLLGVMGISLSGKFANRSPDPRPRDFRPSLFKLSENANSKIGGSFPLSFG